VFDVSLRHRNTEAGENAIMDTWSKQMENSLDRAALSVFSSMTTPQLGFQLLHLARHLRVNYLNGQKPEGLSDLHDLLWSSVPEICARLNPALDRYANEKKPRLAQMSTQALSDHILEQLERKKDWPHGVSSLDRSWRLFNRTLEQGHPVLLALERLETSDIRKTGLSASELAPSNAGAAASQVPA
jgi:hypothetical protein